MDHGPTEQFETPAPTAPARAAPAKRKRPVPEDVLEELPANALEQTRRAKRGRKPSTRKRDADEAAIAEEAAPRPKKKRKAAEPLPPPDAATWKRFEACHTRVALPSRPLTHHDRRHKSSNPTSKAGKKGAESIKKFQQRDAASISFDPIDRCTF